MRLKPNDLASYDLKMRCDPGPIRHDEIREPIAEAEEGAHGLHPSIKANSARLKNAITIPTAM